MNGMHSSVLSSSSAPAPRMASSVDAPVSTCVVFAMSFIPANLTLVLFEECVTQAKQLQFTGGLPPTFYWLSLGHAFSRTCMGTAWRGGVPSRCHMPLPLLASSGQGLVQDVWGEVLGTVGPCVPLSKLQGGQDGLQG